MGCEAPTELKVATIEQPKSDFLTIQEHSSCLLRLCMPGHHPFVMNVTQGDRGNGPLVMKVERPLKCTPFPLKCCCFQQVKIIDNKSQQYSGSVMETFWVCIPQYGVYDAQNTLQYHIHMPSCCFCLPNCCAEGCCRVPFYIYKPDLNNVDHVGKIVKVWGSITSELIGAHRFQVEFPPDSDEFTKVIYELFLFILHFFSLMIM